MISTNNPWADIPSASSGQFTRRRVASEANFALFWFRDEQGRPGLLIEISRHISHASLQAARISIRDISVDVVEVADEAIRVLVIKLEDLQNQDVFLKLCIDLIEHVKMSEQSLDTFHVICGRLKKWQALLSSRARNLLSANEIQGLYAELYFLSEILESKRHCESVLIQSWKGPEKTQHDFIVDDMAIEVKSITGDQRTKIRITSEDQLDTHLEMLYLRVYFLSHVQNGGESLNAITSRISSHLTSRENRELFEQKLEIAGYIDIKDYDSPEFRVKDCRTFLTRDDFPRITRKVLPEGIEAVAYDLVLASIDGFRVSKIEALET
jgi:hypothetical protein